MVRAAISSGLGLAVLVSSAWASADCSKDLDCTGELVCQEGQCVPDTRPKEAPTAAAPSAAPPSAAAIAEAPVAPAAATAATTDGEGRASEGTVPPTQRRNQAMMVGGAVMVPVGALVMAVALLTSGPTDCESDEFGRVSAEERDRCSNSTRTYLVALTGGLLVAGGIPLIVIGGQKIPARPSEPATTTTLGASLSPGFAGLELRLEL